MNNFRTQAIARLADRVDLAIDLFTLGQYGLEQRPTVAAGSEGGGHGVAREAFGSARRGCVDRVPAAACSTLQA